MNELTNPEYATSEFEKLLAESQLNSELKEGTIIKGTVSEIDNDAVTVDIGAKTVSYTHLTLPTIYSV